ncbi:MAG: hypothetical protein ACI350_07460 [Prevotella sp.]
MIIDKTTQEIIHNQHYAYNDDSSHPYLWNNPESCFWPWMADGEWVGNCLYPERHGEKGRKLLMEKARNGQTTDSNSNPIVVLAKEKKAMATRN